MKKKMTLETAPDYLTVQQLVDLGIYPSTGAAHCAFSRGKGPKRMRLDDRKILYAKADIYSYLEGITESEENCSLPNTNGKQEDARKTIDILKLIDEKAQPKADDELEDDLWPYTVSTKWKPLVPIFTMSSNAAGEVTGGHYMPIRGVQGVGRCAFRYNGHTMNFNIRVMWFWGEAHRVDDQFRLAATLPREKSSGLVDMTCWMVNQRAIQVLASTQDCPVGFKAFMLSAIPIKDQFVNEYMDSEEKSDLSVDQDVLLDLNTKGDGRPIWRKEEVISFY